MTTFLQKLIKVTDTVNRGMKYAPVPLFLLGKANAYLAESKDPMRWAERGSKEFLGLNPSNGQFSADWLQKGAVPLIYNIGKSLLYRWLIK